MQTNTAEFKGPKLGPEKCFCHWPTTATQLAVPFCCPVSVIDGRRETSGEILTHAGCVCTRTRQSHKCMCQPLDVSQHVCVCTNERVGTLRSSGGRMLFPHPSLPIISRPDKTPVCWRLQDQTLMSRQLSSQHTADARWLSLSWVPGCMQYASGGQLIAKRQLWYYILPVLVI